MIAALFLAFVMGGGCGFVAAIFLMNFTSSWSMDDER
jgi:hypothetical protein